MDINLNCTGKEIISEMHIGKWRGETVMASLWRIKEKLKTITIKPSSANYDKQEDYARDPQKFSVKRSSLFSLLFRRVRAGMTVEAAVALPLCLLFFVNLGYAVEMIRLHNNLQFALWDVGSRIAMYGCEQGEDSFSVLAAKFYIGNRLPDCVGEDYLNSSPLVQGSRGLQFWETGLSDTGNELDIKLTYQVGPMSILAGFQPFRMMNRCCVRLWSGYDVTGTQEVNTYVYVAENGVVFHRDRNCTHLQLSVRSIGRGELEQLRNQWGQKYSACEKCGKGEMPDTLYVTEEGHCYHYRENCSGIKRTVKSLTLEEAEDYPPCSRCGGQ